MEQPCINNASPYIGCEMEIIHRREIEGKMKWICPKNFNTQGNSLSNEKFSDKYYVTADPSEPPMMHKFRQEDKATFLKGNFKI